MNKQILAITLFVTWSGIIIIAEDLKRAPVNPYNGMQEREEVFEFTEKLNVTKESGKWVITFASKGKCDATVAIIDREGRVIRHLASGVLGANAPYPFQQNSLKQKIEWNGLTDDFKKVDPAGCKVKVSLGLQAKYERDIAWSPMKGRYLEKDGKYFRSLIPQPADTPKDILEKCGYTFATTIWGDKVIILPGSRIGLVHLAYTGIILPGISCRRS